MTDAELVQQTLNGQRSAYEELVRRWCARVVAYSRSRVHSREVAEDLAQDSFLKAYASIHSLGDPAKFGPWLLSIAHRAAVDWLKAKARTEVQFPVHRNGSDGSESLLKSGVDDPGAACERRDELSKLKAEIASLPETLREVLMIYYYDRVTYSEMADMLGVSAATINARLTKARKRLRERLCEMDDDLRSLG